MQPTSSYRMKPKRHQKLAHLTDQQIDGLVARYYAGAKTGDLVVGFGIDARGSELVKLFPPRVRAEIECPHCAVNLWQPLRSKFAGTAPLPYCPACKHEHIEGTYRHCNCEGCRRRVAEVEAALVAMKLVLVEVGYPTFPEWDDPNLEHLVEQLTLRDVVFLSALYRNANIQADGTAGPPYANERPLSPSTELTKAMLSHLSKRGLIRVSAASPLDCFQFDEELTRVTAHYTFKVRYRLLPMLPAGLIGETMHTIDFLADDGFWQSRDAYPDEALALWKELALHECLETFEHQGQLHNLQPPSGEKTVVTFQALLTDLSVAQVYNIVWSAARNAAAYYQRGGVSKPQASNSMVGRCRTHADKAKVDGWTIKPYGRNHERPRSELSHVLQDVLLKIGQQGFTAKPDRDVILSQLSKGSLSADGDGATASSPTV